MPPSLGLPDPLPLPSVSPCSYPGSPREESSVLAPFFVYPGGSDGKESASRAGDPVFIPGLGRSPGGGNGNPLHYSHLENSIDRGAWQATVRGVSKRWI